MRLPPAKGATWGQPRGNLILRMLGTLVAREGHNVEKIEPPLTPEQYASRCGYSVEYVRQLLRQGKIPLAVRLPHGKRTRWKIPAVCVPVELRPVQQPVKLETQKQRLARSKKAVEEAQEYCRERDRAYRQSRRSS